MLLQITVENNALIWI